MCIPFAQFAKQKSLGEIGNQIGTSSLISHLRTNHSAAYQDFSSRQLNFKRPSSVSSVTSASSNEPSSPSRSTITTFFGDKYKSDHPKAKAITKLLGEMICMDIQPFSIVEDAGFIRLISNLEPSYLTGSIFRQP